MSPTTKYGLIVFSVATVFAFGRFTAPTKIVTETKIVEVEKKTTDTEREKHKKTTTKETVQPDGTKTTETTVTEDTNTERRTETDTQKDQTDTKEVTYGRSRLAISALGALNVKDLTAPPVFGVHVERNILGPITVGAFGLTNGTAGVSLGLTF